MTIRVFFAILLCKLLRFASRLLHRGGTAMPGRFALKVCPGLLGLLARQVKTVAITGTNGKTTSARMIEQAFADQGKSYFANRSGANLLSGITTEFVMNSTLSGRCRKEYAVIECDEAASVSVFPQLRPQVIVVTNLFRDQLDRYGEVTHTLANVRAGIQGAPGAKLCLNADCSLTASLADDLKNEAVFFGIDPGACPPGEKSELSDAPHCIRCKTEARRASCRTRLTASAARRSISTISSPTATSAPSAARAAATGGTSPSTPSRRSSPRAPRAAASCSPCAASPASRR